MAASNVIWKRFGKISAKRWRRNQPQNLRNRPPAHGTHRTPQVEGELSWTTKKPQEESLTLSELEANPGEAPKDAAPVTVNDLDAVYGIPVEVAAVLGKAEMQVSHLLKLGRGAVIELDRKVGEAIDIYVNNRLVARGEVVVVEDRLGITMTEIIKSETKRDS